MSEAKSNATPVGSAFVKQAELWMGAQGDVLTGVDLLGEAAGLPHDREGCAPWGSTVE